MEILGKVLSEKTEAIYKDITEGLIDQLHYYGY